MKNEYLKIYRTSLLPILLLISKNKLNNPQIYDYKINDQKPIKDQPSIQFALRNSYII